MSRQVATIGYSGATPELFIAALARAGVDVLVDVRAVPASRKPGFSKGALAATLEAAGIRYLHLPALGNPPAGRAAAKAGRTEEYRRIFRSALEDEAARAALAEVARLAAAGLPCLMCLEADPAQCHRGLIAERLAAMVGLRPLHLTVAADPDQLGLDL